MATDLLAALTSVPPTVRLSMGRRVEDEVLQSSVVSNGNPSEKNMLESVTDPFAALMEQSRLPLDQDVLPLRSEIQLCIHLQT